jgi:hypothetical protein
MKPTVLRGWRVLGWWLWLRLRWSVERMFRRSHLRYWRHSHTIYVLSSSKQTVWCVWPTEALHRELAEWETIENA